jgi:hypothetical protein
MPLGAAQEEQDDAGRLAGCPAHPDSRVSKNGTAATRSGQLQKYLCQPTAGPPHSFTRPVSDEGPACRPPRRYRYDAEVISRALHALARGATYRQARITAFGGAGGAPVELAPGPIDAKLVSRWLDAFAPRVQQALARTQVPQLTVARTVRVGGRPGSGPSRLLLCLVASEHGGQPWVWPARLTERADEEAWRGLFRQCAARPATLLCEAPAQEAAAVSVWGPGPARLRATGGGVALVWHDEDEVSGHALTAGLGDAERTARDAERLVRLLASRVTLVRSQDRADLLVGRMALEVSGLADADSMAAIVGGL